MKKVFVNPQWQGGADPVTLNGADELIKLYLGGVDFVKLPVSADLNEMARKSNGIKGFEVLRGQMLLAYDRLREESPDKLFTLGGGCDADLPALVYLSEKYREELTVLWLDAHGDLNTPEDSASSLFYGMPLRSIMNESCFGLLENRFPLNTSQVIHIGGRDFDEAETGFIKKSGMTAFTVQDIRGDNGLINRIASGIQPRHIYVHLDLDVIDPGDFPNTPLPAADGLYRDEVYEILTAVSEKLTGLGVYEYAPSGTRNDFIEKLIQFGLAL